MSLSVKNTLGGGKPEGLYVWKKYYYEPEITVTNPQFTMSGGSYVYSIYSITNANFDLTLLPSMGGYSENSSSTPSELTRVSGQVADFFDGFKYDSNTYFYLSGTSLDLSAGSKANTMYNFNAIDSSNGWIAGEYGGTGCGSVNNTFKYTGTKVIKPEIKDFIGYIVSDKETAYPDGGEKGGYWYEKVGGFLTGTITQTTNNQKTLSFEYGSVKTPKAFYLMHMGGLTKLNYLVYNTWYDESQGLNNGAYAYYDSPYIHYEQGTGSATCSATFSDGVVTLGGNNYYRGTYLWVAIF